MMSNLVLAPHRCVYSHRWDVLLPYAYEYPYPYHRFCPTCLEQGCIEVGSIELTRSMMDGGRIEYICPLCQQRTIIPLPPELSLVAYVEETWHEWYTPKPGWYHLPKRWPVMCEHALDRDDTHAFSRRTKGKE